MTAEEFIINEEKLAGVVEYSLCWKRTHPGSDKRYPYIKYPGGKWKYVPEEERAEVEAKWEEKCRLKEERRVFRANLKAMSRAERKDFHQQVKLLRIIQSINMSGNTSQMANGDTRDSKSEVIVSDIIERLGLPYVHTPGIVANYKFYAPDFVVGDTIWEHQGRLGDPGYEARHARKYYDYAAENYKVMVTYDRPGPAPGFTCIKVPEILWTMVSAGIVSAAKVLKTYYPGY